MLVGASAWFFGCALRVMQRGVIEAILGWALLFVTVAIGAGLALSAVGELGQPGYLVVHAAACGIAIAWRRRHWATDWDAARRIWRTTRTRCATSRIDAVTTAGVVIVVAVFGIIAVWAKPDVMDAVTYHLPRAAQWLQDGRVHFLPTSDERLNFVTPLPEVLMGWFLTATPTGYAFVILPQVIGGAMTLVATIGLARKTDLTPLGATLSAVVLLGMQNVVAQFTACQTDLFTTGVFAASVYLWWSALERDEGSLLAGFGVMLAIGAKGTLYYLAPGALIWIAWFACRFGVRRVVSTATAVGVIAGVASVLAPIWARNLSAYGSPLAPPNWTERVHRKPASLAELTNKVTWNLRSSLAQNFAYASQPDGLRRTGARIGEAIADGLPDRDPFTLDGIARRSVVHGVIVRETPDVDATSFGVLALVLFATGTIVGLVRIRQPTSRVVLIWAAGVLVFVVFLHAMQVWHPFVFRYLVLGAPWIAIVAGSAVELLTGKWRAVFAAFVFVAAFDVAVRTTVETPQCGWRAVVAPERALPWFVTQSWRDWAEHDLGDRAAPLTLALPEERPLAAFYRTNLREAVRLEKLPSSAIGSAEALAQSAPGWVIVPAQWFLGREGRVFGRTWLFRGDEQSPFSIAAFRRLSPGEKALPLLYRRTAETRPTGFVYHLLVKNWSAATVSLALANPTTAEIGYRVATPSAMREGRIAPGKSVVLPAPLESDAVSEVMVEFTLPPGFDSASVVPRVDLAN